MSVPQGVVMIQYPNQTPFLLQIILSVFYLSTACCEVQPGAQQPLTQI